MDANGDGVGDFQGLMRSLDYLQGLGMTTIWPKPTCRPKPTCTTSATRASACR
ncbi:glycosidase [Paraburkholderia sp. HC6.4b]|nr:MULTISPECIES: alpha-amylase family glycosyl hydrolase [unclassified Paraburkholderia]MBB5407727.1 glycosidase [Paraburkholderia sp. HC6.4b]MBB5452260.1 glycosidase [Paraburkholderia sp. Kb1A]